MYVFHVIFMHGKLRRSHIKLVTDSSEDSDSITVFFLSHIACANAYLTPCIEEYVKGFVNGFKDKVGIKYSRGLCSVVNPWCACTARVTVLGL